MPINSAIDTAARNSADEEEGIKRILHIAHGLSSYTNSLKELARRLESSGVEVIVASHIDLSPTFADSNIRSVHLTQNRLIRQQCEDASALLRDQWIGVYWLKKITLLNRYRQHSLKNPEIAQLIQQSK